MNMLEKMNVGLNWVIYATAVMSIAGFALTMKPHCLLIGAAMLWLAKSNSEEV